jgi:hypothetical protein
LRPCNVQHLFTYDYRSDGDRLSDFDPENMILINSKHKNNILLLLMNNEKSSSSLSSSSQLFGIDHPCPKHPLVSISYISYVHTNGLHIIHNHIQPHIFPSAFIFITTLTAFAYSRLTTCQIKKEKYYDINTKKKVKNIKWSGSPWCPA